MLSATVTSLGTGQSARWSRRLLPSQLSAAGWPELVAIGLQPIPYYIFAFVLLILFGYVWPILPINGGAEINLTPALSGAYIGSVAAAFHSTGSLYRPGWNWQLVLRHAQSDRQYHF